MDDDELTRARNALRGVDPEIDLARVYAESRARARGPATDDAEESWGAAEGVEILLREAGSEARRVPSAPRRRPVLAWGLAAAAAAVLAVSLAGPPVLSVLPGSAPAASPSALDASPSPTLGLTPADVVTNAAQAMAGETCGVKTSSTLGDESRFAFDDAGPSATEMPKAVLLDQQPLLALQTVSVDMMLDLTDLEGTDHRLDGDLGTEEVGGETLLRIRITPSDALVLDGAVTRIELLVDPITWLPRAGQTWAESDQGKQYLVQNEFSWAACGEPSPEPTADSAGPR